jgi:hypothetical protein
MGAVLLAAPLSSAQAETEAKLVSHVLGDFAGRGLERIKAGQTAQVYTLEVGESLIYHAPLTTVWIVSVSAEETGGWRIVVAVSPDEKLRLEGAELNSLLALADKLDMTLPGEVMGFWAAPRLIARLAVEEDLTLAPASSSLQKDGVRGIGPLVVDRFACPGPGCPANDGE